MKNLAGGWTHPRQGNVGVYAWSGVIAAYLALAASLCAQSPQVSVGKSNTGNQAAFLELGKPVEAVLRGGETQSYMIHVEAGRFVHVVVEQEGIDVVVTLRIT